MFLYFVFLEWTVFCVSIEYNERGFIKGTRGRHSLLTTNSYYLQKNNNIVLAYVLNAKHYNTQNNDNKINIKR